VIWVCVLGIRLGRASETERHAVVDVEAYTTAQPLILTGHVDVYSRFGRDSQDLFRIALVACTPEGDLIAVNLEGGEGEGRGLV